jgi:hypothetical protein
MALRVIGAGMPRTGTLSLRTALVQLLGGPCYHMEEVFEHLEHVPVWRAALRGDPPRWDEFLDGYVAAVDWPASAFWRDLTAANPDALVVLSVRDDPRVWWESVEATILPAMRREPKPVLEDWRRMTYELCSAHWGKDADEIDADTAMAAYERRNGEVRAVIPPDRLLEWRATDGWEPICWALRMPSPLEPFPRLNTREEWTKDDASEPTGQDPGRE